MAARQVTVAKLAESLGVSGPAVSNWLSAHARPKTHHRLSIEKLTGIPLACWSTDEEAAQVKSTGTEDS